MIENVNETASDGSFDIIVSRYVYSDNCIILTDIALQRCRSGESARLPPMCPVFDSWSRLHMWIEFVVGSRPCSDGFFSGFSGFPLSSKTNLSKFQFDQEFEGHGFIS